MPTDQMTEQDIIEVGRNCLRDEAEAILNLVPRLDNSFHEAVELIYNCRGKFIITGVGKSGHIGHKIAATLASTGTPSFFVNPLDAYHGDLGMIQEGDVVMAISYSGMTEELLRFLPLLHRRGIPIIGMSSNPRSPLGRLSVCHLDISVDREADPLGLAPTSSTTATLAMGDALACALIKRRNFKESDFAKYHPGGSLGKRLLSHVEDYMVSTDLPIVAKSDKVSDTIIEISRAKQGFAIVIENDKLIGVVTDGDVRRAMQNYQERFFSLTVNDIMSRNPKTIDLHAQLSDASEMMRHNSIHTLVVTDPDGKVVGLIDSFSCL
ncbi:MAG: KpsF/GutQ family sugar-phosphate isomerase [Bacteroidales bacterium]|nr:KpsF/GutQ family sugar-phosphate isomerase [Bacteroidales bacterium]